MRCDASEVVEDWHRRNPLPALPEIAADLRPHWAYCAERRAAAWDDGRKQWPVEAHRAPTWHPATALALWNWGVRNTGAQAAEARRQASEGLAEAVRTHGADAAGFPLSLHLGNPVANLPRPGEVAGLLRTQRPDGTWPFVPMEATRSLGHEGDTALGICANPMLRLLRYASVSVFGTSFHSIPWFGRPVQWVGLVYAQAITGLARHDSGFPWRRVATWVVLSCVQQQRLGDQPQAGNPMPGFFPDSYNLMDGQVLPAWIGPQRMMIAMETLLGQPADSDHQRGLSAGDKARKRRVAPETRVPRRPLLFHRGVLREPARRGTGRRSRTP